MPSYINLFINYADYNEIYNNINNAYEKNYMGRGIGAGFQFNIINLFDVI